MKLASIFFTANESIFKINLKDNEQGAKQSKLSLIIHTLCSIYVWLTYPPTSIAQPYIRKEAASNDTTSIYNYNILRPIRSPFPSQ